MDSNAFCEFLDNNKLTVRTVANFLRVNSDTVTKWKTGQHKAPYATLQYLLLVTENEQLSDCIEDLRKAEMK